MKHFIIILFFILIACSSIYSQWFAQTLPVSGTINDIAFLNKDTGFVAMDNSNFLRTTNGGANCSVMTSFRIEELEIIDKTTLYARAVNQSGFYQTFDGGTTWNYLAGQPYCAFSFINRDTGWFSAFPGGIYKTTNGGVTAQLISTENNCCTKLIMLKQPYNGEYYGWSIQVFSRGLFKTTNSGVNWIGIQNLPEVLSFFILIKTPAGFLTLQVLEKRKFYLQTII